MRYILIDPYAKTVTEAEDAALSDRERQLRAIYRIMGVSIVQWQDLQTRPLHDVIIDENALLRNPAPPSFMLGNVVLLNKAMIMGRRGNNWKSASLPLERVRASVNFDVGDAQPPQPEVMSFGSEADLREMMAKRPRVKWLL